jgi:putative ABC transport system permease protein
VDLIHQAWRAVRARPAHALLIILSLAAGVAANAVIFAVVDAAVLRPFPFPDPHRIVGVGAAYPRTNRPLEFFEALSGPEYLAIREQARSLERTTGFDLGNEPVMIGPTPERVFTAYFWDDPLPVLGMVPLVGRSFSTTELDTMAPVALLSHRYARAMSDSPDSLVGTSIRVGGVPRTIIGILPPRVLLYGTDLWLPMTSAPGALPQNRRQFNLLARVAGGSELATVEAELARIAAGISGEHTAANPEYRDFRLHARPWTEIDVWGFRHVSTITFAAAALLLVLIASNLANLMLARSSERSGEMAIRAALGAPRGRLAAQVLVEMLMLAAAGGLLGVVLTFAGLQVVAASFGDLLPDGAVLAMNERIILFAFLLSAVAGAVVAVAPVLQLIRREPASILSSENRRFAAGGTRRIQRTIVVCEVTTALVVTGSALLLSLNVHRVLSTDPGFSHEHMMAMRVTLPLPKYEGPRSMAFFDAVTERVGSHVSVASVTLSNQPPPGVFSRAQFSIEGVADTTRPRSAFFTTAGARYGETLGFTLVRGRWFDARAGGDAVREIVINEAAVTRFFDGEDPIGRRLLIAPPHSDRRPTEIVGVIRDVRNRGLTVDAAPEIIASVRQIPDRRQSQLYLVVRGRDGVETLLADVRGVLAGLDAEQPVYAVSTIASLYESGVSARRAAAVLSAVFSIFSLGLAALGIYGVVSRTVHSRRREIGIRAALGAGRAALRRMVVLDAIRPVALGLVAGLALILAGHRVLANWLYGITPEPTALLATGSILLAVGLLASALPAWRASRIDPAEALRGE